MKCLLRMRRLRLPVRVLLMRMGWVAEEGEARFEPVPGVASRLKCRGQVIATTRKVTYEVSLKEIGYGPEPFSASVFGEGCVLRVRVDFYKSRNSP